MTTYRKTRNAPSYHEHQEGAPRSKMSWVDLADHLVEEHGWTEGMIARLGREEDQSLFVLHKEEHASLVPLEKPEDA